MYSGHSGGPVLTADGTLVGWVSRSQNDNKGTMVLDEYRPVDPPTKYTEPLQCIWGAVAAALGCPGQWQQADVLREMLRGEDTIEAGTYVYDPDGTRNLERRVKELEKPDGLAACRRHVEKETKGSPAEASAGAPVAGSLLSAFGETGSIAPSETEMPQQQMFALMRQMQAHLQAQDVELHATREELRLRKQRDVDNSLVGLFNTGRPKSAATSQTASLQATAVMVASSSRGATAPRRSD